MKITPDQAAAIIADPRVPLKIIGEDYGISASYVRQIKAGLRFAKAVESGVPYQSRAAAPPMKKTPSSRHYRVDWDRYEGRV